MTVRQAVVIIHGIGEQRPLDTLRGFVKALVQKPVRNKPDAMSRLFELRRLQVPSDRHTPLTDFYEYYWAYRLRDTHLKMIWRWVRSLLFRTPRRIPRQLLPFYLVGWVAMITVALSMLQVGFVAPTPGSVISVAISLLAGWLTAFLYGYVGDAARYLDPHPDNIEQRNKIRDEGIALLNSLHESKKYSRIIVVGHSLGSVIGYDLIRLYWSSLTLPALEQPQRVEALHDFDDARDAIFDNPAVSEKERVERYQQLQFGLWKDLREQGHWPWLITDFITLGSPLTYAKLLLARSEEDFEARRAEGELVACPPVKGVGRASYNRQYSTPVGPRNAVTPTHMVPFSCTRWTNIYFPNRWIILGDLVGGPLRDSFGAGIRDVAVGLKGFCGTLASHVCYWGANSDKRKNGAIYPDDALKAALRLDCLHNGVKLPPP